MSFNAGSIKATLDLDHTSFDHGIHESHTHAETEGGHIREAFEAIAETLNETAGPAFAKFGQAMQSALAGFSEGPALGALNLFGIAAGNLREATMSTGEKFDKIGLAAEKAGVDVETFSKLVGVAATKDVGIDQLTLAFKNLQEKAVSVTEGNKAAIAEFDRIGISVERAGELSKEPAKLFDAVQTALQKVPVHATRLKDALDILGQRSQSLVPLMAMSRDEFDNVSGHLVAMGGVVTEENVKQGEALKLMTVYWNQAMEGIERAASKPVLVYFAAHMDEIEPKIEKFTKGAMTDFGNGWKFVADHMDEFKADSAGFIEFIKEVTPMVEFLAKGVAELTGDLIRLAGVLASSSPLAQVANVISGVKSLYGDVVGPSAAPAANQAPSGGESNAPRHDHYSQPAAPAPAPANQNGQHRYSQPMTYAPPQTNHYHVQVTAPADSQKTAAALAPIIKDAIDKAQKSADQKTAGALAAQAASQSLGGG